MQIENTRKTLSLFKLILFFVFCTKVSTAQNNNGVVLDNRSKVPLAGVNVYLEKTGTGTTTNEKGLFNLEYFLKMNENDTLYFSYIGYVSRKIKFSELKEIDNIVLLSEDIQNLKEVTIAANRILSSQIHYQKLSSLKVGLYSFGSLIFGDKIFVIGGDKSFEENEALKAFSDYGENFLKHTKQGFSWQNYSDALYIYDIQTNNWVKSTLKFRKRAYHNMHYFEEKIYVLGGKRLSINGKYEYLDEKIEVYDIKRDTVLIDNVNPHQAVNFASFVYNDNLIVIGGSTELKTNGEKEYSNKVHLYNLKTGYWYELNDMPLARETKGVLIENTIYLIGGFNNKPLTEIETYNIITGEWKIAGQLFYGVESPAVTYNENIIYIFEDGRIQTYNIDTKELNVYLIDLSLKSSELFSVNNRLYILGGFYENEYSISPSPNLYSIDLNEFERSKIYNSKIF